MEGYRTIWWMGYPVLGAGFRKNAIFEKPLRLCSLMPLPQKVAIAPQQGSKRAMRLQSTECGSPDTQLGARLKGGSPSICRRLRLLIRGI